MLINGDEIAALVIARYDLLPKKGKPLVRSNGVREWTVLAGIVIFNRDTEKWECVSLATGVKAVPETALAKSQGRILHDCHAEILAIRAFNYYCLQAATDGLDHIGAICLYVCTPPCGDASMSLVNSNGGEEWTRDPVPEPGTLIRGRAHFNCLGFVRTKPGRADSNVTMSKSCSDKLCLRQNRGLLLSPLLHHFGKPIYLDALVCPSESNQEDFERAFSRWSPKTRFQCIDTATKFTDFHPLSGAPSPCSIIWTPFSHEVVANGVIQGSKSKPSVVSRAGLIAEIAAKGVNLEGIERYYDLKKHGSWPPGWIRTCKDDFDV